MEFDLIPRYVGTNYMKWNGKYTRGECWVRGTEVIFHKPFGYIFQFDQEQSQFVSEYPTEEDNINSQCVIGKDCTLRVSRPSVLIDMLSSKDAIQSIDLLVDELEMRYNSFTGAQGFRDLLLAKQVTSTTKIFLDDNDFFFHHEVEGLIQELKEIEEYGKQNNVVFHWI